LFKSGVNNLFNKAAGSKKEDPLCR